MSTCECVASVVDHGISTTSYMLLLVKVTSDYMHFTLLPGNILWRLQVFTLPLIMPDTVTSQYWGDVAKGLACQSTLSPTEGGRGRKGRGGASGKAFPKPEVVGKGLSC